MVLVATAKKRAYRVGEQVRFQLGAHWVQGHVVEDLGFIAVGREQLVRVEVSLDDTYHQLFEVPSSLLQPATPPAVVR
jgi:hypothetical protein